MIACVLDCRQPRRHTTDCPDPDTCHGCQPRPATHGALCDGSHFTLTRNLTQASPAARLLRCHLPPDMSQALSDERHGTSEDGPAAPIRLAVLDVLSELEATLADWARGHAEQHDLRGPATLDTATTSGYLLRQLASVECMDGIAALCLDLADVMHRAHREVPWRVEVTQLRELCPDCHAPAMVMYGGQDVAQCRDCGYVMSRDLYEHWARVISSRKGTAA